VFIPGAVKIYESTARPCSFWESKMCFEMNPYNDDWVKLKNKLTSGDPTSRKRDIREKNLFPGHSDGLDQLLSGIRSSNFIRGKWCPGIIHSIDYVAVITP